MLRIRTILHPTDFSDRARDAYRLACALARDHGANVLVAHVNATPVIGFGLGVVPPVSDETEEDVAERLRAYADAENPDAETRVVYGDPVTATVRLAEQAGCDLIVMGTHGWTGLNRMLMGSVAEGVVRRAGCPVLTVRQPLVSIEDRAALIEEAAGI